MVWGRLKISCVGKKWPFVFENNIYLMQNAKLKKERVLVWVSSKILDWNWFGRWETNYDLVKE